MFVFCTVILFLFFFAGCFQTEKISPICTTEHPIRIVNCSGIDNLENFRDVFYQEINRTSSNSALVGVRIANSHFRYIAQEFFKGLKFRRLSIENTALTSLSDTDTAFEGLENYLQVLIIKNSVLHTDLDWYQLRNLRELKFIILENIELEFVDSDMSSIAAVGLIQLSMDYNRISHISDKSFAPFVHLQDLSLLHNEISELKRSMFPNPGNKLSRLNLGYNKISSLPSDFFTNMPSLTFIVLSHNELLTLDQAVFATIWKSLITVILSENPFQCDCRLKWLRNQKFPMFTYGTCAGPPKLRGKDLAKLEDLDLWCF